MNNVKINNFFVPILWEHFRISFSMEAHVTTKKSLSEGKKSISRSRWKITCYLEVSSPKTLNYALTQKQTQKQKSLELSHKKKSTASFKNLNFRLDFFCVALTGNGNNEEFKSQRNLDFLLFPIQNKISSATMEENLRNNIEIQAIKNQVLELAINLKFIV